MHFPPFCFQNITNVGSPLTSPTAPSISFADSPVLQVTLKLEGPELWFWSLTLLSAPCCDPTGPPGFNSHLHVSMSKPATPTSLLTPDTSQTQTQQPETPPLSLFIPVPTTAYRSDTSHSCHHKQAQRRTAQSCALLQGKPTGSDTAAT